MTEANSPMFALGCQHGLGDALRIGLCPPQPPLGEDPPNPDYPWMYRRGYHREFDVAVQHVCTERCRK